MHEDEQPIDADLVRRLLAAQFSEWAELPLRRVESAGTDNALYRLGENMVVRLPRIDWAISQIEHEYRWLPKLAPHLPLKIPVPLAMGEPGEDYPWHWSVNPWFDGQNANLDRVSDPAQMARDLAAFITALRQIDTTGGPLAGTPNVSRGVPVARRDTSTRTALRNLETLNLIDIRPATEVWEIALAAPAWDQLPVWFHGDLHSGNLLALDGRLSAVIDFGCLGVGDPAVDLLPAWNLLTADSREVFRTALQVDDATWARGRGWALSFAAGALSYYHETNPFLAGISRYAIDQILADYAREEQ
jgi:aminoglycoside phosphotransferase (APT) family kinase protein